MQGRGRSKKDKNNLEGRRGGNGGGNTQRLDTKSEESENDGGGSNIDGGGHGSQPADEANTDGEATGSGLGEDDNKTADDDNEAQRPVIDPQQANANVGQEEHQADHEAHMNDEATGSDSEDDRNETQGPAKDAQQLRANVEGEEDQASYDSEANSDDMGSGEDGRELNEGDLEEATTRIVPEANRSEAQELGRYTQQAEAYNKGEDHSVEADTTSREQQMKHDRPQMQDYNGLRSQNRQPNGQERMNRILQPGQAQDLSPQEANDEETRVQRTLPIGEQRSMSNQTRSTTGEQGRHPSNLPTLNVTDDCHVDASTPDRPLANSSHLTGSYSTPQFLPRPHQHESARLSSTPATNVNAPLRLTAYLSEKVS